MAAVFVLPATTAGQFGPVAAYLSTAGWAAAGQRLLGNAWIVCPTGVIDPAEARRRGTATTLRSNAATGAGRRHVPVVVKTLLKDLRRHHHARQFTVDPDGPWRDHHIDFVWQRHELFHTAGLDLARSLGVPSVLFAPATTVWEAERWGTRRPGWGPLLERVGEAPALQRADVVACGSGEVIEQALRLGTPRDRIVETPTGVDLDLFPRDRVHDRGQLRRTLGLTDRFVVGWVGSFRPFHTIERAVDAVDHLPDATLLLVGDGPERPAIEALARERGVNAVFTGTIGHGDLPNYLAAMDVGLVLAPADAGFHYSPLKLGEYLAAGLAVVAPAVPTVAGRLTDGHDGLLVAPGDPSALRAAISRLHDDPDLRHRIGVQGRLAAEDRWSWDVQLGRVLDVLRPPDSEPGAAGATGRSR